MPMGGSNTPQCCATTLAAALLHTPCWCHTAVLPHHHPSYSLACAAPSLAGGNVERAAESVEETGQDMEKSAQQNQGKEQVKRDPINNMGP